MEVQTNIGAEGKGRFYFAAPEGMAAEMEVSVRDGLLTVFHTEVTPEYENRGLAKSLLTTMVAYARAHKLKVAPLCPFVSAQFRRHPADYADLWQPNN